MLPPKPLLATAVAAVLIIAVVASGWRALAREGTGTAGAVGSEGPWLGSELTTGTFLPAATPTPVPQPPGAALGSDLVQWPLEALSPEAAEWLATLRVPVGVAVVVPSRGAVYVANADQRFPMASVAKLPIMLTTMDRAVRGRRALTPLERRLLEEMITLSDNDAAIALWQDVGGPEGVRDYLRSAGVSGVEPDDRWGASRASARGVALLLDKLVSGEILDEPSRTLALSLMNRVEPSQRWGVAAGVTANGSAGAAVGVKNGWYPDDNGWWVNSAGFVISSDGEPSYTIAILSDEQPGLEYAIRTIGEIARLIDAELRD